MRRGLISIRGAAHSCAQNRGFEQEPLGLRLRLAGRSGRRSLSSMIIWTRESRAAILKGEPIGQEEAEGDEVDCSGFDAVAMRKGAGRSRQGILMGLDGRMEIKETTRPVPTLILTMGIVTKDGFVRVDSADDGQAHPREDAARNHTATHLVMQRCAICWGRT